MTDRREAILSRLAVIAAGVPGIKLGDRNRITPSDTQLPAIIIYDADEIADEQDPRGTRPANAPRRVKMAPEISILLGALPNAVGTSLNGFRAAFLSAVFSDATLLATVLDNIGIRYLGCSTSLADGRELQGTMWLRIEFTYPLMFSEL